MEVYEKFQNRHIKLLLQPLEEKLYGALQPPCCIRKKKFAELASCCTATPTVPKFQPTGQGPWEHSSPTATNPKHGKSHPCYQSNKTRQERRKRMKQQMAILPSYIREQILLTRNAGKNLEPQSRNKQALMFLPWYPPSANGAILPPGPPFIPITEIQSLYRSMQTHSRIQQR